MGILLANNATSTLTTVVSTSGTTVRIDPADAGKFPAIAAVGDYFMAVLQDDSGIDPVIEIVKVTARSGATMTVQRAQEGTTGRPFPVGASFSLRLTAATMAALIAAAIVQMQEYPGVLRVITNLSDIADPFGIPYEEGQYGIFVGTNTMYRFLGGAWTAAFQFPLIQGYIANTQMTPGMITNLLLATDAVDVRAIADAAVTTAKIAEGAVDTTRVGAGAINTANLALKAVEAANIADGAVTGSAILPASIGQAQLAVDSVGAAQIIAGAVGQVEIAAQAVTSAAIALSTIQHLNIDVPDIVNNILKTELGYVGTTQITPGAVTSPKIAAGTIVTSNLAAGEIVANFLAVQTGYVNTAQIVNGAITTALIQNAAITTALIQVGAITTALIQNAAITTALIAEAAINTAAIADLAVGTAKIADLSVNGEKITGNTISADYYAYGASPGSFLPLGVTCPDWGDGRVWIWAEVQTDVGNFNWNGDTSFEPHAAIVVTREGTPIYVRNFTGTLGIYFPDTPGAGGHNYVLEWQTFNMGDTTPHILTAEMFILVMSK